MEDTICAVATATTRAGIAVLRLSGQNSLHILKKVFFSKVRDLEPRRMTLGEIRRGDTLIDQALAVYFPSPASYTGEEMTELHCHGGEVLVGQVFALLVEAGARPAQPGEFTKRAFLNGKLDLSQAEAVQGIISSVSREGAQASARQLAGELGRAVHELQNTLTDALAALEAGIEYPEEDLELDIAGETIPRLKRAREEAGRLVDSFRQGKLWQEGIRVALIGRPNVGKSSLLNALLGEERAIVTHLPGTTRDVIEEYYDLQGLRVAFLDTAGIRDTADLVEQIGVKKSREALKRADFALFLLDAGQPLEEEDISIWQEAEREEIPGLVVLNKSDLPSIITPEEVEKKLGVTPLAISAKTRQGLDALKDALYKHFSLDGGEGEGVVVTQERHREALRRAIDSLEAAIEVLNTGELDCASIDIRAAWEALGEITGETVAEEIIDRIFDTFCLGK